MGRRTWIDSGIWYDTRKLTSAERDLYLHLLINDNGNSAGYYRVNLAHLSVDMGVAENEVVEMLKTKNKFWMYDEATEQVLIPKYTKYNKIAGGSQVKRLNADLAQLTPCWLHKEFLKAWDECNGIGATTLIDDKFQRLCI